MEKLAGMRHQSSVCPSYADSYRFALHEVEVLNRSYFGELAASVPNPLMQDVCLNTKFGKTNSKVVIIR